jgi:hypothetical protein
MRATARRYVYAPHERGLCKQTDDPKLAPFANAAHRTFGQQHRDVERPIVEGGHHRTGAAGIVLPTGRDPRVFGFPSLDQLEPR